MTRSAQSSRNGRPRGGPTQRLRPRSGWTCRFRLLQTAVLRRFQGAREPQESNGTLSGPGWARSGGVQKRCVLDEAGSLDTIIIVSAPSSPCFSTAHVPWTTSTVPTWMYTRSGAGSCRRAYEPSNRCSHVLRCVRERAERETWGDAGWVEAAGVEPASEATRNALPIARKPSDYGIVSYG